MPLNPIAERRLIAQRIAFQEFRKAKDVVAYCGAMQAQEFAMVKWAIGLRSKGLTEKKIDAAFNQGKILRTHLLRPTWHFATPEDIRWILMLTAPRVNQANAYMYRQCKLTPSVFSRTNTILAKALEGGHHLTRENLQAELSRQGIKSEGFHLAYIMMRAELDQVICSGPRKGNQFTYALLDERAPSQKPLTMDEALLALTMRYFTSRGPATVNDFSYWSGLTVAQVKKGVMMAKHLLTAEKIDGQEYFCVPSKRKVTPGDMQSTFLMPDYDEYGMSYKNRSALSHPRFKGKLDYNRALIVDGVMVGSWRRTLEGKKILLEIKQNIPLSKSQLEMVKLAAQQYGAFYNKEVKIIR